jgi:predicted transposase YbfD/YdcC
MRLPLYLSYFSSLAAEANKLNSATRDRWAVENYLHWTLDMTFNEDASRIRLKNAPENIAIVRHTALNLLWQAKAKYKNSSLKGLRKMAGWDNNTLAAILGQNL